MTQTCDIVERVESAVSTSTTFPVQVRRALESILADVAGGGLPPDDELPALTAILAGHAPDPQRGDPSTTAQIVVGGVYELLAGRVRTDGTAALPALLPDLVYSVLVPYLGHERALAER